MNNKINEIKETTTSKEQERAALHRAIWRIACDIVHGGAVAPVDF